jgi:hypothetical protein
LTACNRVMHKRCFEVAKSQLVHAPSGGIVVDQNISTLATLGHRHQILGVTANTEKQKAGNRGPELKTEVLWLRNTRNSAVYRMKVELKIGEKCYVDYYKLDVKKLC